MISIFWTDRRTRELPEGGDAEYYSMSVLELDIAEQDSYDVSTTLTALAVESGVPISDHFVPNQDRATVTVCVSGRQISTDFVDGATAGTFEANNGISGTGIIVPENDRRGEVHTALRRLCREAIEVDVDGLRRPIEGWVIESVSSPRSVETSGLLVCDIVLVEIRYAETEEVEAPSPRVERGRRQQNRGRQQTENRESVDDQPQSNPDESWLHGILF